MEEIPNPLHKVKPEKPEPKVRFGNEARTEELKINKRKREIEKELKQKSINEKEPSDSDSDVDQAKKKLKKKIKKQLDEKIKHRKTFERSSTHPTVKVEVFDDVQNLQQEFSAEFADFVDDPKEEVKVEEVKTVGDLMNMPLPLHDFFTAAENQAKTNTKNNNLDQDGIVRSYYVALRLHSTIYGNIARQYEFIATKLKKRMPLDPKNPETIEDIKNQQKKPVLLTREYEQARMRNPYPGTRERSCVNGAQCEFHSMFGKVKVTGVECLNPDETLEFERTGKLPEQVRPCILCRRRDVETHWLNARQACGPMATKWLFQDYYNDVELDGEYLLSDCIMSSEKEFQAIPYPVVRHVKTKYTQRPIAEGVWMYFQEGYLTPEEDRAKRQNFC